MDGYKCSFSLEKVFSKEKKKKKKKKEQMLQFDFKISMYCEKVQSADVSSWSKKNNIDKNKNENNNDEKNQTKSIKYNHSNKCLLFVVLF